MKIYDLQATELNKNNYDYYYIAKGWFITMNELLIELFHRPNVFSLTRKYAWEVLGRCVEGHPIFSNQWRIPDHQMST